MSETGEPRETVRPAGDQVTEAFERIETEVERTQNLVDILQSSLQHQLHQMPKGDHGSGCSNMVQIAQKGLQVEEKAGTVNERLKEIISNLEV